MIPKTEGKKVEFKRDFSSPKNIYKTCVAFANTAGGSIFVGIGDSGKIIGLEQEVIDEKLETFHHSLYQAVAPLIVPNLLVHNHFDLNILEIQISAGGNKPYYVTSEGSRNGIFIRSGRSNIKPTKDDLKDVMFHNPNKVHFDMEIASLEATIEDLDSKLLNKCYPNYTDETLERERVALKDLGSIYRPTVASMMVFGKNPQKYLHESGILLTLFRGTKGRDIIRTHEIRGNIPSMIQQTVEFINEYTSFKTDLVSSSELIQESEFPIIAIREIIANALIHRKYQIHGATKVAIFSDRVEIFSPGELPPQISAESLGDGTSQIRNTYIAKFARKLKLIEKLGSGIRIAMEALEENKFQRPNFLEQPTSFKVTLFRRKQDSQSIPAVDESIKVDPEKLVKQYLTKNSFIVKNDLVRLGIPSRTATTYLKKLVDEGVLVRKGKARATIYQLANRDTSSTNKK